MALAAAASLVTASACSAPSVQEVRTYFQGSEPQVVHLDPTLDEKRQFGDFCCDNYPKIVVANNSDCQLLELAVRDSGRRKEPSWVTGGDGAQLRCKWSGSPIVLKTLPANAFDDFFKRGVRPYPGHIEFTAPVFARSNTFAMVNVRYVRGPEDGDGDTCYFMADLVGWKSLGCATGTWTS